MARAGFTHIGFGLETGSARLLSSIHKNITKADVVRTFEMLKGIKINAVTYLMVGFPGETNETVAETISLVKTLQKIKYFEFVGVARLWVYPNTEVYDIMKAGGRIDDAFWLTDRNVPFFTLEHSEEGLDMMVARITLACTPWRQAGRRMFNHILHPVAAVKKNMGRLRRLKKMLFKR
jgi:radical SAM superfamily enzyme YgiQ (UPF0313 family)